MPARETVEVGDQLPVVEHVIDQDMLIRYAGASGDFNRLHWDPEFAAQVSPTGGVIGHGMLSMGLVSSAVTAWAGGPEHVAHLSASFRAPCPVGATLRVGGEVTEVDHDGGAATVAVWAETEDGARVVDAKGSRAVVRLSD
ncbi:MaoC family dehydratase [Egibacter rhizosphaerae]|nr:MaoC/PaaZ C-terminal domain-containing protein [Egibacter rhizosphaerae]